MNPLYNMSLVTLTLPTQISSETVLFELNLPLFLS